MFDGLIWIDKSDFSIIRSEGEAVPQIRTTKTENLFPRFTTVRRKVDTPLTVVYSTYLVSNLTMVLGRVSMVFSSFCLGWLHSHFSKL